MTALRTPLFAADSSVWIDFLAGRPTPAVRVLRAALGSAERVAMTDVVLTEVLQGLPEPKVKSVESKLAIFPVLQLRTLDDFRRAAAIYRAGRQRGITIRRTTGCLIASVCIRDGVPILHSDRDFDQIAEVSELRTVATG